jgi:signal peptidase II
VPSEHVRVPRATGALAHRRPWLAPATAALVIAADQVTKTWALHLPTTSIAGEPAFGRHIVGSFYLDLTFNSGAAFGLGRGVTPIVEGVVVVLVGALLLAGRRASRRPAVLASLGLGLVVGGALGNLADRVLRHHGGAVIDFFNVAQVGNHEYWPVFNVADSCIVVGAILLAYQYSRPPAGRDPRRAEAASNGSADD